MRFEIDGNQVYASTGGREHQSGQPWLIFLHGAGFSHLTWSQQSRSFAYGGYNVLALDFPGHHLSGGAALSSIEAQAEWLEKVMDALSVERATLVGHSQGGLVNLALWARASERIEALGFVATAAAIPVNDMLISTAEKHPGKAYSAMTSWGLGPDNHHFDNTVPGVANPGLMIETMNLNPPETLAVDLKACRDFEGGLEIAATVTCPTLCVFAGRDRMTPIKFGKQLAAALSNNRLHVLEHSGHTIPAECPHELNEFLRGFLQTVSAGKEAA